jgi:exopolysaccharide biosynthesis polyprenyl glycosylphosphotransferase
MGVHYAKTILGQLCDLFDGQRRVDGAGLAGIHVVRAHCHERMEVHRVSAADIQYPLSIYFFFPLVWVFVLAAFSIYDGKKFFKLVDELSTLSLASLVAAISQAGILYLSYRDFSRALFLMIVAVSFLLCVFWRLLARVVFRVRKETLTFTHKLLVIGVGAELHRVEKELRKSFTGSLNEVIARDIKESPGFAGESAEVCPNLTAWLRSTVELQHITDVVLAFPRKSPEWVAAIPPQLEDLPIGVWIALDFYDLSLSEARVENVSGLPLLDLRAPALDDYSRILKRAFDIVIGSLIVLILSPLLLIIALFILLVDGAPVFFLQDRIGENGRKFKIFKFRTMVRDAETLRAQVEHVDENGDLIHKVRNDPRITRLGRILRRFSLDELPQFFNVLLGDMSIVGPRPELPYLVESYEHWQRRRLTVPPGITGWWQVTGRSDKVMHLHTEDDIYYIENYSIWLDLQILIRTVWVVLIGKGSF